MSGIISQIGYLLCAIAFGGLTVLVLLARQRGPRMWALAAATLSMVVWGTVFGLSAGNAAIPSYWPVAAELIRDVSWLVFLSIVAITLGALQLRWVRVSFASAMAASAGYIAYNTVLMAAPETLPIAHMPGFSEVASAFLILTIGVVFLLENIYRSSSEETLWAVRFFCFGLGALFAYDFLIFADALLFQRFDPAYLEARGYVAMLSVPLIAIAVSRQHAWRVDIHVSRKIAFHSASLIAAGLALLAMSLAGLIVRQVGAAWGGVLQITLIISGLLLAMLVMTSGAARARIMDFISRNFYSTKYDYRGEWRRFSEAIEEGATAEDELEQRIARSIARTFEASSVGLWLQRERGGLFEPAVQVNMGEAVARAFAPDSTVVSLIQSTGEPVDIGYGDLAEGNAAPAGSKNDAAKRRDVWLASPIASHGQMIGFLVIGRPRTGRAFDAEDVGLFAAMCGHAAGYIGERMALTSLYQSKQFEEISRRTAFVAHDLKNIVNQLSLMMKNAERHANNPEFQKDMIVTVGSAVDRMTRLLGKLSSGAPAVATERAAQDVSLRGWVERVARDWEKSHPSLRVQIDPAFEGTVRAEEDRLTSAVGQLIQNAFEAGGAPLQVSLTAVLEGDRAVITITDNGAGMSEEFVRKRLFQPQISTKQSGFGIGLYQIRAYVREAGGELDVKTAPGRGTTMRIELPLQRYAEAV